MYRQLCVAFGATAVAAFGATGCSTNASTSSPSSSAATELSAPTAVTTIAAPPTTPLPPPEALIGVLSRLADPAVPGADKQNLVEGSPPEIAGALDRFTTAARDGGYLPMTFAANNIAWSDKNPSVVTATIIVTTAQPNNREFTFPMKFTSATGGWQLSRRTADMLLALGNSRNSTPAPSPAPTAAPPG